MSSFWTYTLTTLNDPNANLSATLENGTNAFGINDAGQIVGTYANKTTLYTEGFLYSNGTYTNITGPLGGSSPSTAHGINNLGYIVGSYVDFSTTLTNGYIYFPSSNGGPGSYATLFDPDPDLDAELGTIATAINDSDEVVGDYADIVGVGDVMHGFLYSTSNETYTTLTDPLGTEGTWATGINDAGEIVGYYVDSNGDAHGFLYSNGVYTTLNEPSTSSSNPETFATGINNAGEIVGYYVDSSGVTHGFLYGGGSQDTTDANYYALADDNIEGAGSSTSPQKVVTELNGINDAGDMVGVYADSSGVLHGFEATATTPVFTALDYPSASGTSATGINNQGQIVGLYANASGVSGSSYLYSGGTYTAITDNLSGATSTTVAGINDSGAIVGSSETASGTMFGFVDVDGSFSKIVDPSGPGQTAADGINDSGEVVGQYINAAGTYGFLDNGGVFTTLNDPNANGQTSATGINSSGEIVGGYHNGSGEHGFVYDNGVYTTLDDPLATNGTLATGINDAGTIVGIYQVGAIANTFIYSDGIYVTLNDPSGRSYSGATGINNEDQIVGTYTDSSQHQHGFVTDLVYQDTFTAVESVTGDEITGFLFDDTGKYKVGSMYQSGPDSAGGTWTYTVDNIQVASSPFQNPVYSGYIYDVTYYDAALNMSFETNVGQQGYSGVNPLQNYSGKDYFGSDNDTVTIDGNTYAVGSDDVVPRSAQVVTPTGSNGGGSQPQPQVVVPGSTGTGDTSDESSGSTDSGTPATGAGDTSDASSGSTDSGTPATGTGDTSDASSGSTDSGTPATVDPLNVSSGATDNGASVTGGETLNVLSGGTINGVTVDAGGTLNVSAGGLISGLKTNDPRNSTAQVDVLSGGTVDGNTRIDGGMLLLDAGADFEPHANLTLIHAGQLILEEDTFKGTIKDFGGSNSIDLTKIKFIGQGPDETTATWTQTNRTSGVLQVEHGNQAVDLHMTGYYSTANFALGRDGGHGTTISFAPNDALPVHR